MARDDFWPEDVPRPAVEWEGIKLVVPERWEVRISRLKDPAGESAPPVLHVSTVPLSGQRSDYGKGVVERLGQGDVFVALIEFGPDEAGTALFKEVDRIPRLLATQFKSNQLQKLIKGQAGKQHFFTYQGRAFCLYVVLGSMRRARELVAEAQAMLSGLVIDGT